MLKLASWGCLGIKPLSSGLKHRTGFSLLTRRGFAELLYSRRFSGYPAVAGTVIDSAGWIASCSVVSGCSSKGLLF